MPPDLIMTQNNCFQAQPVKVAVGSLLAASTQAWIMPQAQNVSPFVRSSSSNQGVRPLCWQGRHVSRGARDGASRGDLEALQ